MSKKTNSEGSNQNEEMMGQNKLLFEALLAEVGKMVTKEIEGVHERINRDNDERFLENRHERRRRDFVIYQRGGGRREGKGGGPFCREDWYEWDESEDEEFEISGYERRPRRRDREDNILGNINIPSFQGKNDPEAYLEWERKVELIFYSHNYSEFKKVKLAALEFSYYALVWWDEGSHEEAICTILLLQSVVQ